MSDISCIRLAWSSLENSLSPFHINTVGPILVHAFTYLFLATLYAVPDIFPYFHQWKIQSKHSNSLREYLDVLFIILRNQVLLIVIFLFYSSPQTDLLKLNASVDALPSLRDMLLQVMFFMILEDFYAYWTHRLLHLPFLYRNIHYLHHEHSSPFGLTAEHAHPLDGLNTSFGILLGPLLFRTHTLTFYIYVVVLTYFNIEIHSGYEFPWSLSRTFRFLVGADFHDHHHVARTGNFGTTLVIWDALFGTDRLYKRFVKRREGKKLIVPNN